MREIWIKVLFILSVFTLASFLFFRLGLGLPTNMLLVIMLIDYVIEVSLVLSGKKHDESMYFEIGFNAIITKIIMILLVELCALIDNYLVFEGISYDYLKEFAIIGFSINELTSIIGNVQLIGIKLPKIFNVIMDKLSGINKLNFLNEIGKKNNNNATPNRDNSIIIKENKQVSALPSEKDKQTEGKTK